jgi:hypothetical protein
MSFSGLWRVLWNRLGVVPLLLVRAERDLRSGRFVVAERRFAAAARRAPACFRAHFGLARVHVAQQRGPDARRELAIARHLAPSRYRELRRTLPTPYRDEEQPRSAGHGELVALPPPPAAAVRDDFVDDAERRRFRAMGPLVEGSGGDVVWDRLAAELERRDG